MQSRATPRCRELSRAEDGLTSARLPCLWPLSGQNRSARAQAAYQRIGDAPPVKPPPMPWIITRSPRLIRPSSTEAASASGIEAAEVLPCRSHGDDHSVS